MTSEIEELRITLLQFVNEGATDEQAARWRPVLEQPAIFTERMKDPEAAALALQLRARLGDIAGRGTASS